jgi:hypothetical protein
MNLGIVMSLYNNVYFKDPLSTICEFVPQVRMFVCAACAACAACAVCAACAACAACVFLTCSGACWVLFLVRDNTKLKTPACETRTDPHPPPASIHHPAPQMIFLNALFGYLSFAIVYKWISGKVTDLYHVMIYMFLAPGGWFGGVGRGGGWRGACSACNLSGYLRCEHTPPQTTCNTN